MRDRLIELIRNAKTAMKAENLSCDIARNMFVAEHLLANGVIVPPCEVGDKLYIVTAFSKEIVESVVVGLWLADGVFSLFTIHGTIMANLIGENVFLTKEEAERALKEREEDGC